MSRATLRRFAHSSGGAGFPHDYQGQTDGEFPFFKVADFAAPANKRLLRESQNRVSRDVAATLNARPVPPGAVLLPKVGAALLGNARRITTEPSLFDNNILAIVPERIDSRYLQYWLSVIDAAKLANPGPVPSLSDSVFLDLPVPITSVDEQGRIADYLDTETARIDALIEKKRRMRDLIQARFEAVRWRTVAGCLDGSADATDGFPTPAESQGWSRLRLAHLVEAPKSGAWGEPPGVDEVDVSCVRVADFDRWRGEVDVSNPTVRSIPANLASRIALQEGDLLLEKSGGGEASPVGFVAVFRGAPQTAICSNFIGRMRPVHGTVPGFVADVFAALYEQRVTAPFIKQTTGIQNLDARAFLSMAWAVPSVSEQTRMHKFLVTEHSRAIHASSLLVKQLERLSERRKALITAAVTGEFEVPGVAA